nr:MAG TPA: hypothetical protein [Caudoviricetes sp.]
MTNCHLFLFLIFFISYFCFLNQLFCSYTPIINKFV